MNPGLVVKLRPSGPWRIGPDSGARNRVDVIYHSDSLYSAITAAMSRLGWLEEWLDATARTASPAVSFSSCFPFLGDIAFVVPPRTVWPPASNSTKAARIRWKSARFVPLTVVQSILSGQRLDENQWSVDGPSDCLVPAGKPGPFRTAVRSNAGVDRLSGASERHSTACIEFRAGSGLWTVVSFAGESGHEHWSPKVKAAFRLLADSGFGGERSRGWGRSEAPEFIEGMLPGLILPAQEESAVAVVEPGEAESQMAPEVTPEESTAAAGAPPPEKGSETSPGPDTEAGAPAAEESASEAQHPEAAVIAESDSAPAEPESATESQPAEGAEAAGIAPADSAPVEEAHAAAPQSAGEAQHAESVEAAVVAPADSAPVEEAHAAPQAAGEAQHAEHAEEAHAAPESATESQPAESAEAAVIAPPVIAPLEIEAHVPEPEGATEPEITAEAPAAEPAPPLPPAAATHPHWLLSLFTPAPADLVDWQHGNYTLLPRGGRVESPAGSGELKKQIQMVAEGSVLYAETPPRGSAADVAPDGFAHPVFRAGFAVAIPLPEVR